MGLLRAKLPGEAGTREVYLASISRGGIGIYLHKEVKLGQRIVITVRLKTGAGNETEEKVATHVV